MKKILWLVYWHSGTMNEFFSRKPSRGSQWTLTLGTWYAWHFFPVVNFTIVIAGSNILCVILLKFENVIIFLHSTFWCNYYYIPSNKFNDHFKIFNLIWENICMSTMILQLGEINLTYKKDNNKTYFRQQKRWLYFWSSSTIGLMFTVI